MRLLWFLLHVATAADPDPLRERIYAVSVQAAQAYNATEYTEAHARGLEAQALAKKLPKRDPFRLTADLRVADALFGLDRYEEAAVIYQGVVDLTERQKTIDEATLLIEAASNLGITHHQLGDLAEARVWHQTAWELIQFHQLFTPLRFLVANQYAVTAIAQADYEAAVTLRTWILTSVLHEFGEDHVRVAAARLELASVYGSLAAWPEAAALLEQARSIYERDPSHAYMLAETDRRLAEVHCAASEVELAVAALERSTRGFRSIFTDDDPQLSGLISTSANVATLRGDLDAALRFRRQELVWDTAMLGADHYRVATLRSAIAELLIQTGELAAAEAELDAILPVLERALGPQHPDVASVRMQRGRLWIELGRPAAAVAELEAAIVAFREDPGSSTVLPGALGSLAYALHEAGDPRRSEATHLEALALAGEAGPITVGHMSNGYGALLLEQGRYEEAEYRFRLALAGLEAVLGPDHLALTGSLNNLALVSQQRGNLVEAQELYERVLAIEQAKYGDWHPDLASTQHNLGILHLDRGDVEGAKRWLERSLAIKEKVVGLENPQLGVTLDKLASIAQARGEPALAEALGRRSLAVRSSLGDDHPAVALSLDHLATLLVRQHRYDEAEPLLRRSLAISLAQFGADSPRTIGGRYRLLMLKQHLGDEQGALAGLTALLASIPPVADDPGQLFLRRELGLITHRTGDPTTARAILADVLTHEEQALHELLGTLSERERLALTRAHRTSLFYFLQAHEWNGDPLEAYRALLRFKSLGSRSLTVEQPATLALADPTTYTRWTEVKARLAHLALAGDPNSEPELAVLSEEKEALRRTLAKAAAVDRAAIEQIDPLDLCRVVPGKTTLVDFVRRSAAGPDGSQDVYTAFVLPGGCSTVSRIELGPAAPLDALIAQHRSLLASRAPTSRVDRVGKKLRQQLWDPLVPHLEAPEQVYLVPDSALATLSFAALPLERGYLVEQVGLRTLDAAIDARPRAGSTVSGALVVGGVDYGAIADAGDGTRAACVSGFPALPATSVEATAVAARLAAQGAVHTLGGAEATKAALVQGVAKVSTVHLATHGFFATGACRSNLAQGADDVVGMNPLLLTGVALAGANTDSGGIWTAEEISTLPLGNVDLVVLSACETGLGEIADGEGVQGLRRAFALSGNRATVMSLWPVDDAATQALMDAFYEALSQDPGRDEQAALRSAQRVLLKRNLAELGEARPETWAAFVVSGAPRAR